MSGGFTALKFKIAGLKLQEKNFWFVKKKYEKKIKISCSITNLTKSNLAKPNQI